MSEQDCTFCKIASKEIPTDLVYEGEHVVAFRDINPQAPIHIILIPKVHIHRISDITEEDRLVVADLVLASTKLAKKFDIAQDGYRLVINCNEYGGQAVFHLHMHLLGGRQMTWPPG